MRKSAVKGLTILMLVLALVLVPLLVQASPDEKAMDVIVLIDNSGSMSTNDPSGLRHKVPTLTAKQLTEDDRLGILVFSLAAETQVPLAAVPSAEDMGKAFSIDKAAGDTDLTAALEAAKKEFGQRGRLEARRAVIFVTDAIPDPGPSFKGDPNLMSRYLRALSSAAVALAQDNCCLYGVYLGKPADLGLLEELCNQAGGFARHVTTERQLATLLENIILTEKKAAGDKASSASHAISLQVISPLSGDYLLGNQLQLEAAIIGGSQRLTSGSFDKQPSISCVLNQAGEETVIALTDDGTGGDVLADDGLYSGAIALERRGQYALVFEVNGSYQGRKFSLKSQIEDLRVLTAGEFNQQQVENAGLFAVARKLFLVAYPLIRPYLIFLWILPILFALWLGLKVFRKRKQSPAPCLQTRLHRAAGYHVYYDETKKEPK